MKMYEIEMGDYSIRILITNADDIDLDNLDAFYYNRDIMLHPYSVNPLTITEYQEHREYYEKLPVDLYVKQWRKTK